LLGRLSFQSQVHWAAVAVEFAHHLGQRGFVETQAALAPGDRPLHIGLRSFRDCTDCRDFCFFAGRQILGRRALRYLQDLTYKVISPWTDGDQYEVMYGPGSFWENKSAWLENAPGFNLDRVQSPILLTVGGVQNRVPVIEWYASCWNGYTARSLRKVSQNLPLLTIVRIIAEA
jgi:hypothetical protein